MKRFLTLTLASVFTIALVGCRASAEVEGDNDRDVSMKKTTKVERDGDSKVTYEKKTVSHD